MNFMILPELEDYVTLYNSIKFHNLRTPLHDLKKKKCTAVKVKMRLFYFAEHFDILEI